MHQLQPITCLVGLFQCNFQLCDKIFLALRVLRFVYIRAYGSTCSYKLIGHISTFEGSYAINEINNCNRKIER